MRMRVTALVSAGFAIVVGLPACAKTVDKDDLEQQVKSAVADETGLDYKRVNCADDLDAEEDATTKCTLAAGDGSQVDATVTVTGVEGDDVSFNVKVADRAPQ